MKRGLLIVLSGPSGVGKGTVRKLLMKNKALNLAYSISMTTRSPRNGEVEGSDYFFVSKETFEDAIKNNKLLEYAQFVNNFYGTPVDYVNNLRNQGKNVLLEIETNGAQQVMKKMKNDDEISIFLDTPSLEELERRIRGRQTEKDDVIRARLEKAKEEIKLKNLYDYVVLNDTPENAALKIENIIKSKSVSIK